MPGWSNPWLVREIEPVTDRQALTSAPPSGPLNGSLNGPPNALFKIPGKRQHCTACLRPQDACFCKWVTPTHHQVEVLILQHPSEVAQAKGTARLLHMSLPGSRLLVGETLAADLEAALKGPRQNILLYPQNRGDQAPGLAPPALNAQWLLQPDSIRLVVLDGTWRKSRKMLHLNPRLQQMPRLLLTALPASRYLIRKAHEAHQLSTLEATCAALAQLAGKASIMNPLLNAFDGFINQQLGRRQASVAEVDQA